MDVKKIKNNFFFSHFSRVIHSPKEYEFFILFYRIWIRIKEEDSILLKLTIFFFIWKKQETREKEENMCLSPVYIIFFFLYSRPRRRRIQWIFFSSRSYSWTEKEENKILITKIPKGKKKKICVLRITKNSTIFSTSSF